MSDHVTEVLLHLFQLLPVIVVLADKLFIGNLERDFLLFRFLQLFDIKVNFSFPKDYKEDLFLLTFF